MENSDSKPRFEKTNHDGNRPNKPLQLRKKSDLANPDRRNFNNDNKKTYGNQGGNRPYSNNHPNRFNPNSTDGNYGNNERSGNNYNQRDNTGERSGYNNNRYGSNNERGSNRYNNDRNDRNYDRSGGGERRTYNNGERPNHFSNDRGGEKRTYNNGERPNHFSNDRGGERGNRPYNPNRFDKPRNNNYQQDDTRYDENNKKVVFRKRKNPSEGQERKHFTPPYKEEVDLTKPVRLNKFLANAGVCSRREADDFIQAGVISVNGEIKTELGTKILPTDNIMFHEQPVRTERKIYLILNKPKDFVTTVEDTHDRKIVMDLVKNACSERIYPVGRLDRNTTGVLLFTNDGDLASRLTHPKYEKKKIYDVTLDKDLTDEDFNKILNEGIELEDGLIKADDLAFVKEGSRTKVGIEIHSGKNRIVRRIFDKLGYKVRALDRVYFAGLTKKNLPRGKYRFLNGKEISTLKMGAYQ